MAGKTPQTDGYQRRRTIVARPIALSRFAPAQGTIEETVKIGAGDEIRTHDPHVGNVMLYP